MGIVVPFTPLLVLLLYLAVRFLMLPKNRTYKGSSIPFYALIVGLLLIAGGIVWALFAVEAFNNSATNPTFQFIGMFWGIVAIFVAIVTLVIGVCTLFWTYRTRRK